MSPLFAAAITLVICCSLYYCIRLTKKRSTNSKNLLNPEAFSQLINIREQYHLNNTLQFDVAGYHIQRNFKYFANEPLEYVPVVIEENPNAAITKSSYIVKLEGVRIGYLPEELADSVRNLLNNSITHAYIKQIKWRNGHKNSAIDISIALDYHSSPAA